MKLIKGGTLVSGEASRKADIAIQGKTILQVAENISPAPGDQVIDATGCLVFPGFIDAHTHFDMDNGKTITADSFSTGTAAAVHGGTTTIIDFATQDKGSTLKDALAAWHRKADGVSSCNYGFHMAITDWNLETDTELEEMVNSGVTSFKTYMAYDALRVDDAQMLDILRGMKRVQGNLGVHCENGTLINDLVAAQKQAGHLSPAGHPASRPAEVEAEAINRLCYIASLVHFPVTVVHLSTELGLLEIEAARSRGQQVNVETCPQYLLLTEEKYHLPGFESAKYVCSPPLRKERDRQALIQALAGGRIQTIATDHCSYRFDGQKSLGKDDFAAIPNGMPGVEHRPVLFYTAFVDKGLLTPSDMCRLLSENPAKLYGMYPQKGVLQPGSDADIVIFEPGYQDTLSAKTQLQNVDYTPFEGVKTTGRACTVLLGGETVVDGGSLVAKNLGTFVHRKTFDLL